jgi:hypothetical protein
MGGSPNGALFSLFLCDGVLPAEWLKFSAHVTPSGTVNLDWTTSSEINTDYFIVERSADGAGWETIGEQDAAGNSQSQQSYGFEDTAPGKGLNHYRIRQTSLDGSATYSQTELIWISGDEGLRISPNPAQDFVQVSGVHDMQATVVIFNHLGQVVEVPFVRSEGHIIIKTSHLSRGVYFIRVLDDGRTAYQNLILE